MTYAISSLHATSFANDEHSSRASKYLEQVSNFKSLCSDITESTKMLTLALKGMSTWSKDNLGNFVPAEDVSGTVKPLRSHTYVQYAAMRQLHAFQKAHIDLEEARKSLVNQLKHLYDGLENIGRRFKIPQEMREILKKSRMVAMLQIPPLALLHPR